MSSLPPRAPGSMFSRFAKRDPQLYPLAVIMLAVTATGGYFLAQKSQTHDAARAFGQVTPAWEAHKPGDNVSEWKTRFKTKRGTEGDFGSVLTSGGEPVSTNVNNPASTPKYNRLADRAHDLL